MMSETSETPEAGQMLGSAPTETGRTDNLSITAYRTITEMIRSRVLRGGDQIVESRLASDLNISRTPLREALQRLEGEGLVLKTQGRSYVVRKVDLGEYLQSLKVRELLEPEAAAMAAPSIPREELAVLSEALGKIEALPRQQTEAHWRADDLLHALVARYSNNDVLARAIHDLRVTMRLFEVARLSTRVELDQQEHLDILKALERREPEAVREAVRTHLRSIGDSAIANIR